MRKWLFLLLLAPTVARGAGAGGINLTLDPRALLRSTNTWTAAQTFSSGTFTGDLTIDGTCTGCGAAAAAASTPRVYDLVVGTPGTPNVDVYVTSTSNFNLALASAGLCGLTTSSTATARFLFRNGIYNMHGSTIPRGLEIVSGSSVVWVTDNSSETLTTIYGKVDGVKFDMQSTSITCRYIDFKSSASLTGFELYNQRFGQRPSPGATYRFSTFYVNRSMNVKVQGTVFDSRYIGTVAQYGDNANFMVFDSSDVNISLNMHSSTQASTSSVFFLSVRSKNVKWADSYINGVGGDLIVLEAGTKDFKFERNHVVITQAPGDEGLITMQSQAQTGLGLSSFTLVANNHFELANNNSAGRIVRAATNGGNFSIPGIKVLYNTVSRPPLQSLSGWVLASLAQRAAGAIVGWNTIDGCSAYLQDLGAGTISQGNLLNAIPQPYLGGLSIGGGSRSEGRAGVSVGSTTVRNLPLFSVSSDTLKFEVTGNTSTLNVDFFIGSHTYVSGSSLSVRSTPGIGGGAVSASTYNVNGLALFNSTWSTFGMDGTVIRVTTGSIANNTTIGITAANLTLGSILWALCAEVENVNTAATSVRLKDMTALPAQINVYNADVINTKDFSCITIGKP